MSAILFDERKLEFLNNVADKKDQYHAVQSQNNQTEFVELRIENSSNYVYYL